MEVKYDIIRPNLYIEGNNISFSTDTSNIIRVARSIEEIVGKHIDELKVTETDLETIRTGKCKSNKKPDVPLREYLNALEERNYMDDTRRLVTNNYAELFGMGYLVDASTLMNFREVKNWLSLQKDLANPDKMFDEFEEDSAIFKLDRLKTLEQMNRLNDELNSQIPDNYAGLFITYGISTAKYCPPKSNGVGQISFSKLKAKDETQINNAKSELVEMLKGVDGPCLSLDASQLIRQVLRAYDDASDLIQKYGDVLKDPNWKSRFFKFDP